MFTYFLVWELGTEAKSESQPCHLSYEALGKLLNLFKSVSLTVS